MGWTVQGSNPDGARFSAPVQTGPGAHPASCTMGTGSFPEVKYGWGVLLTTHPLLVPRSWKSRAIPLPTLWATTGPVTGTLYIYLLYTAIHGHVRHASLKDKLVGEYGLMITECPTHMHQVLGLPFHKTVWPTEFSCG